MSNACCCKSHPDFSGRCPACPVRSPRPLRRHVSDATATAHPMEPTCISATPADLNVGCLTAMPESASTPTVSATSTPDCDAFLFDQRSAVNADIQAWCECAAPGQCRVQAEIEITPTPDAEIEITPGNRVTALALTTSLRRRGSNEVFGSRRHVHLRGAHRLGVRLQAYWFTTRLSARGVVSRTALCRLRSGQSRVDARCVGASSQSVGQPPYEEKAAAMSADEPA